jgi:hypothetical protein
MPAKKATATKKRRQLDPGQKARILQAGRAKNRPSTAEVAGRLANADVAIVRRVWQAHGIVKVSAPVRDRARSLVATWQKRGAEQNGSGARKKATGRKSPARKAAGAQS